MKQLIVYSLFLISITSHAQLENKMSVNVKDSPMRAVFELIAAKSGLELVMDQNMTGNISVSRSRTTSKSILDGLAIDQQIEYTVTGNQLIITKRGISGVTGAGDSYLIPLKFANASEMIAKVNQILDKNDRVIPDENANSLIFIGSKSGLEKVKNLISLFDVVPKQIMIEAIIVSTSHSFLQDIGISTGDLSDPSLTNSSTLTGYTSAPGSKSPNASFKAILGQIDGRALDIRLTAAESNGTAKIVSRPKVVTLNNRAARVNSGVTLNVRTLSNVPNNNLNGGGAGTGSGVQNAGVVTGSVTGLNAALSLSILPLLVGDEQIKMIVDINDSSPDMSTAVDGIPGIMSNSASTAVIVKNKQTAVIAGLVKQANAENSSGVPILKDIPILGNLFKSKSESDKNNELVIFLTPTIDDMNGVTVDPELLKPKVITRKPFKDKEPTEAEKVAEANEATLKAAEDARDAKEALAEAKAEAEEIAAELAAEAAADAAEEAKAAAAKTAQPARVPASENKQQ